MTVWQFLGLSFIIMSAGSSRCPTTCSRPPGSMVLGMDPVLADHRPDALADAVLRRGGRHDLRLSELRADRHPHRTQQRGGVHANVLIYYIYESLQIDNNAGQAAVLSIVLFVITLSLTLVQMRYLERRVTYAR